MSAAAPSLQLAFAEQNHEKRFAQYYGLQYQGTYLVQNGLMLCLWLIRAYHFFCSRHSLQRDGLLALAVSAALLHSCNMWDIRRNPWSCTELRKATAFVGDLALCTVAVIMSAGLNPSLFTNGPVVHMVHGWGSLAGGFRLSAQGYLQLINLECYLVLSASALAGSGLSGCLKIIVVGIGLVLFDSVLPALINLNYEIRQRAIYIQKFEVNEDAPTAWSWEAAWRWPLPMAFQ